MTNLEKRALYNLLRMHWLNDRSMQVELWQVEDYRSLSLDTLFERLSHFSVQLDKLSFMAYADMCDSPEDLTSYLLGDRVVHAEEEDRIYLSVFELWRQLMVGKPSLSVFCNDLDQQIYLYDQGKITDLTFLSDALVKLLFVLNENVDAGIAPQEAIDRISAYCANDLEAFLYDFISDQTDEGHESYALELLDGFGVYFPENKWFALLRAKLFRRSNIKSANKLFIQIVEDHFEENDLDFNLEYLSFMAESGTPDLFKQAIGVTIPLLLTEEDLQDLLSICIDYFHRSDLDQTELSIRKILTKRSSFESDRKLRPDDKDLLNLITILDVNSD